jgi:mono/diheme cytochrome c family protein
LRTVDPRAGALRAGRAAAALCLATLGLAACTDWAMYDVDRAIGNVPQLSVMRVSVVPDPYAMPRGAPEHSIPTQSPLGNVPARFAQTALDSAGAALRNPLPVTPALVAHGQVKFHDNCSVCHGDTGTGNGSVVGAGKFPFAPSLVAPSTQARSDGYLYAVLVAGRNFMPPYGERLTETDRWAIVSYVRQLQGRAMQAPGAAPAATAVVSTSPAGAAAANAGAPVPTAPPGAATRPTTTP